MTHPATRIIDIDPNGLLKAASDLRRAADSGKGFFMDSRAALRLAAALEKVQEHDIASQQMAERHTRQQAQQYAQSGELVAMARNINARAMRICALSALMFIASLIIALMAVIL